MKTQFLLFLIPLLLFSNAYSFENKTQHDSVVHVAFYSKIYSSPSFSAQTASICEDKTPLKLLGINGQWLEVSHNSITGWIHKDNITESIDSIIKNNGTKNGSIYQSHIINSNYFLRNTFEFNVISISIIITALLFILVFILTRFSKKEINTPQPTTRQQFHQSQNNYPPQMPSAEGIFRVHGTIHEYSLYDIFQMLETTRKTGALCIKNLTHNQHGMLHFRNGMIVYADFDNQRGRNAVLNVLKLNKGTFDFIAKDFIKFIPNCMVNPTEVILTNAKAVDEAIQFSKKPATVSF